MKLQISAYDEIHLLGGVLQSWKQEPNEEGKSQSKLMKSDNETDRTKIKDDFDGKWL